MGRRYKIRCRECRRRKVKCTAEQPKCSRCTQSGIDCPGYDEKKLEFVAYQHELNVSEREPATIVSSAVGRVINFSQHEPFHIITSGIWPIKTPSAAPLNLIQLWSAATTSTPSWSSLVQTNNPNVGWFLQLPKVATRDTLVEHSLQALTLVHLGKTQNDDFALRMARLCFASALKQLQTAARKKRADFNILAAAVTISLYELYDCPTVKADGWVKQVTGAQLSGIIVGPESLTEVDDMKTWIMFRTLAISSSFCTRKRCILAHVQRLDHLVTSNSPPANLAESLEDIAVKIPEVVEQSDQLILLPCNESSTGVYSEILGQWRQLNYQLNVWISSLHKVVPHPVSLGYTTTVSHIDFGPSSLTFDSYFIAHGLLQFWAGKVLLYDALRGALRWILEFPAEGSLPILTPLPTILYPEDQIAHDAAIADALSGDLLLCLALVQQIQHHTAISIRKGMRYMLASDFGILPQFRAATPLIVATQYLKKIGDEQEVWHCEEAAKYFEEKNIAVGLFIESCAEEWGNQVKVKRESEGVTLQELELG